MVLRVLIFLYFILVSSSVFSEEIPVIVISASKKPQSLSSVGTSVTILDEKFFNNSTEFFLKWRTWDIISNSIKRFA